MKLVTLVLVALTLTACGSKETVKPVTLTSKQTRCFDVAENLAKTIPGKDVYYNFAIECGSKEEARAFRTGTYTKA